MNLGELLEKGIIRKVEPDENRAASLIATSGRDIKAAGDSLASGNQDWALAIAYNSMLSSGMALMAAKGYAAISEAHHLAVVQFCAATFPKESGSLAAIFNRYRVRRHDVVYGEAGSVGKEEAAKAIENAKLFLATVKARIGR